MAIGGEAVVSAMAPLLTADSWTLRVLTAETLGRISRPPQGWAGDTAEALLRGLGECTQHPHWWVRRSALESAGHLCLQGIAPALPAAVRDEEFLVVRMACLAAAQIAAPAAPELVVSCHGIAGIWVAFSQDASDIVVDRMASALSSTATTGTTAPSRRLRCSVLRTRTAKPVSGFSTSCSPRASIAMVNFEHG